MLPLACGVLADERESIVGTADQGADANFA
jgi:hypothetical protein